jgi:hypothetical protein
VLLPDTSFRSLFLLTGMTTCGCYSQPEDTEMITSVVGTFETWRPTVTMSVYRVERSAPGDRQGVDGASPSR